MKVRTQTLLVRHYKTGVYYFRQAVPEALRPVLNRVEIKRSLKTTDPKRAKELARIHANEASQLFERARAQINPQHRSVITADEARLLAKAFRASLLRQDERFRIAGDRESLDILGDIYSDLSQDLEAQKVGLPRARDIERRVNAFLQEQGISVDAKSEAMRTLLYFFRIELQQALEDVAQRVKGRDVPTPEVGPAPMLLSQAFERWAKEQAPRAKTLGEARKVLAGFTEMHGDFPLASVTKAHGIAFKDALLASGAAPATVRKHFGLLKACLQSAVSNDYIARNPFDGVKLPEKGAKVRRKPFRVDQLQTLFAHPLFTKAKQTRSSAGEAAFWLTLMSLYGGGRLAELCQLRVADFLDAPELGTYYRIEEREDEDARLKNEQSTRDVPVHDELIRLGLLDYVNDRRKAKDVWLFPHLKVRENGNRTGAIGHALNRLIDEAGLTDSALVFHSFRHTWITFARESGLSGGVRRAIAGHEGKRDPHDDYGEDTHRMIFAGMARYRIAGLDLSGLQRPHA